jgi:hypothetical protein
MADENQLIDDAINVLNEISDAYRNEHIAELAALLSQQIRPTMAFDSPLEERRRIYERTPKEFADEAAKVVSKRGPAYKTPIFKCVDDFEKCKKHSLSQNLCRAVLAICVAKHLIPFVKHK